MKGLFAGQIFRPQACEGVLAEREVCGRCCRTGVASSYAVLTMVPVYQPVSNVLVESFEYGNHSRIHNPRIHHHLLHGQAKVSFSATGLSGSLSTLSLLHSYPTARTG